MSIDKPTLAKLKKFADAFKAARERNANESDTVMILIKFFEEVLGYDPLSGEITKEIPVKERYCDFAIVLDRKTEERKPEFLVEAKAAGVKSLIEKHIEQAYNYASRAPVHWVLLTNGLEWQLYHLAFDEKSGITPDRVFEVHYLEDLEANPDFVWDRLSVLAKTNVRANGLETYYELTQLLSPKTIVSTVLGEEVLRKIRQELDRQGRARLELRAVFDAVVRVLNSGAVAAAGDIMAPTKKRRRRRTGESKRPEAEASAIPIQAQPQPAAEEETPT
jgi:predicted type IV restriction endonuclease